MRLIEGPVDRGRMQKSVTKLAALQACSTLDPLGRPKRGSENRLKHVFRQMNSQVQPSNDC
jgi:hypothetical protein